MKSNILFLIAALLLLGIASPQKANATKKEKAEIEVAAVLDNLHSLFKAKDVETYSLLLSDEGLYCGTDSKEFWDKASIIKLQKEIFSTPDFQIDYKVTKQVIRVAEDGKSALAVEQFVSPGMFSPHIPVRITTHHIKTKNGWKIDFIGWSLVPDNEDLEKIIKALEE